MTESILKRNREEAALFFERRNVFRQEHTRGTVLFVLTAKSVFIGTDMHLLIF